MKAICDNHRPFQCSLNCMFKCSRHIHDNDLYILSITISEIVFYGFNTSARQYFDNSLLFYINYNRLNRSFPASTLNASIAIITFDNIHLCESSFLSKRRNKLDLEITLIRAVIANEFIDASTSASGS